MANFHKVGIHYETIFTGSVRLNEEGNVIKAWNGQGIPVDHEEYKIQVLAKWEVGKNCSELPKK